MSLLAERFMEHQSEDQAKKAANRYLDLHVLFRSQNDKDNLELLEDIATSANDYTTFVAKLGAEGQPRTKEDVGTMDQSKHNMHNGLISRVISGNTNFFRTYKRKIPVGGIYTLDPEHISILAKNNRDLFARAKIAEWAGYLVAGIFGHGGVA